MHANSFITRVDWLVVRHSGQWVNWLCHLQTRPPAVPSDPPPAGTTQGTHRETDGRRAVVWAGDGDEVCMWDWTKLNAHSDIHRSFISSVNLVRRVRFVCKQSSLQVILNRIFA